MAMSESLYDPVAGSDGDDCAPTTIDIRQAGRSPLPSATSKSPAPTASPSSMHVHTHTEIDTRHVHGSNTSPNSSSCSGQSSSSGGVKNNDDNRDRRRSPDKKGSSEDEKHRVPRAAARKLQPPMNESSIVPVAAPRKLKSISEGAHGDSQTSNSIYYDKVPKHDDDDTGIAYDIPWEFTGTQQKLMNAFNKGKPI
jgi:hypothetical protein